MSYTIPIIIFLFSIGLGLSTLYLLLGLYGYVHNRGHKEQKQYLQWIVYAVGGWVLVGILFYAVKDLLTS